MLRVLRWPWLELLGKKRPHRAAQVTGRITEYDAADQDESGAKHQIFTLEVDEVVAAPVRMGLRAGDRIYVAVRHGEGGIEHPIPMLREGESVELCGAYIPPHEAYDRDGDDRLGVIHFTHRPLGWVRYHGRLYE